MTKTGSRTALLPLLFMAMTFAGMAAAPETLAAEDRWAGGIRYNVLTAGGEPTNDQMGFGVFGRYRLNDDWLLGFSLDQNSGDFETPYKLFGNNSPEDIDSTVDSTIFSAWIEQEFGPRDRKLRWFWAAGVGFTSPDVDDVSGPLTGGGTFDITTDAGSETLLSVTGGFRWAFSKRFGLEAGLRIDQHFADWELSDRANGTTATLDDYTAYGMNIGFHFRF